MPDWVFHIGFALLIGVLFKIKNWKLLITGSILPDLSRILMIIFNHLGFDELRTFIFLEPIHTPFISLLLSLSIAMLFENSFKNFLLIYFGALTHFFLDFFQFAGAFGIMFLYPFYYKEYALNLFYENIYVFILGIIILSIGLFYLKERNNLKVNKKFYFSFIPLLIALIFLVSTRNILIEHNIHGTNFILHPEKYDNKEVNLYDSKIISLNPLKLDEMGRIFVLDTNSNLKKDSLITINGIYKDNKIKVNSIFFNTLNKLYFSLSGLLIYIYLIFKKD